MLPFIFYSKFWFIIRNWFTIRDPHDTSLITLFAKASTMSSSKNIVQINTVRMVRLAAQEIDATCAC